MYNEKNMWFIANASRIFTSLRRTRVERRTGPRAFPEAKEYEGQSRFY